VGKTGKRAFGSKGDAGTRGQRYPNLLTYLLDVDVGQTGETEPASALGLRPSG